MNRTLKQIAADQALIYRPINNAAWFAQQIEAAQRAGKYELAAATAVIAERHNILIPAGKQVTK